MLRKIQKESGEINLYRFSEDSKLFDERLIIGDFNEMRLWLDESSTLRKGMYCFILVKEGFGQLKISDFVKIIARGDLICGIPGDVWNWISHEGISGKFIMFEAPYILAGLKGGYSLEPISFLNSSSRYPFISVSEKIFSKLNVLIDDMRECILETPVFHDLMRAYLWQFIFLAEKEFLRSDQTLRQKYETNYIPSFINLVNRYFAVSRETKFYADKLNISSNYLNKLVHKSMGVSTYNYVIQRVISEAKLLLRLTDIKINELAYELGFETPNHFINCFKKIEGITPKIYRNKGTL